MKLSCFQPAVSEQCRIVPGALGESPPVQVLKHRTSRFKDDRLFAVEYHLAVEEFLEIVIDGIPYAITMRLPGDDINLVTGFCFTEGIIDSFSDVLSIDYCEDIPGKQRVLMKLKEQVRNKKSLYRQRNEYISKSSCGLCGKSRGEEICADIEPVQRFNRIRLKDILVLKDIFESGQAIFPLTGSTHSASIFGIAKKKKMMAFAEDIGRHNALDKAIGSLVRADKTDEAFLAIVSSRLSFEMVQKAGMLGLEIFSGLSAPTSMAVQMADRLNITLIGFLRENSMSIYTHPERILSS